MNNICVDDFEHPEFYVAERRKARKEHKCSECGRIIQKGETYEYVSGKWDGNIMHYKTCADCLSIRDAMFCEGWAHSGLYDDLWDYLRESDVLPENSLESLTERAQEKVMGMISKIKEDKEKSFDNLSMI
jgi:hypothetical protein